MASWPSGEGGLGGLVEASGEGVKPEPVTPVGEIPAGMILFPYNINGKPWIVRGPTRGILWVRATMV